MPKVTKIWKARKDFPDDLIKRGDTYYWWKFRTGPTFRSLERPRRSQLTNIPLLADIYDVMDACNDVMEQADLIDEVIEACRDASEALYGSSDGWRGTGPIDSMAYTSKHTEMYERMQEAAASLESLANDLESPEHGQAEYESVEDAKAKVKIIETQLEGSNDE